jgi:hypothetical protein
VLEAHAGSIRVTRMLIPLGLAMAGREVYDPYKDCPEGPLIATPRLLTIRILIRRMPTLRFAGAELAAALLTGLLAIAGIAGCGGGAERPKPKPLPNNHPLPAAPRSAIDPAGVSVFPVPGSRYGLPGTQITFRGLPASRIGDVRVVGSQTGPHAGLIRPDSDGHGGSFLPLKPFAPGETVTVTTRLDVLAARDGTFSFTIEHPAPQIPAGPLTIARMRPGGVRSFRSAPGLAPASVALDADSAPASLGDIFLAPQDGPLQDGPMILGPSGKLIWFHPTSVAKRLLTTDFRVQRLHGKRVLTWWQGSTNRGSGRGVGVIVNRHYRRIATVHAGNGLQADLHEFLVTPGGDAYVIAASPVALPGDRRPLIDSVVQEIDIKTGLVLFEWHALDHVSLEDSYKYSGDVPGHVIDPYHLNSISLEATGNLIVSMRNTSAVYEIDHRTGQISWTLGGKHSSFTMGPGTQTAFQHAATVHRNGTLTIFDNGAGPPKVHQYSRGITVALDTTAMTASLVKADQHAPGLSSSFEGDVQTLAGGETFLGYGQKPYFTEFDAAGAEDLDGRFITANSSYRAYRFRWSGRPDTKPSIAATSDGISTTLYVSWNGATGVARWRVLGGRRRRSLRPLAVVRKRNFETGITVRSKRVIVVQALSRSGRVLARSRPVRSSG